MGADCCGGHGNGHGPEALATPPGPGRGSSWPLVLLLAAIAGLVVLAAMTTMASGRAGSPAAEGASIAPPRALPVPRPGDAEALTPRPPPPPPMDKGGSTVPVKPGGGRDPRSDPRAGDGGNLGAPEPGNGEPVVESGAGTTGRDLGPGAAGRP